MNKNSKLLIAFNVRLPKDGTPPEWVELIPAGELVIGRDSRQWINPTPEQIVAAFLKNAADLPIDWEHATETKAPNGDKAPAAGWITAMEVRSGAIWGKTEWTDDGADDLKNKRYRYLSPVFFYTKKDHRIIQITSAGLTNQPNLHLTALNRQTKEEADMELLKALCKLLGLADDTTEDKVVETVTALKGDFATAKNQAETPSLEKFVPRGDYDAATTRAVNAEQKLKGYEEKVQGDEIDTAINQALEDGKITPGSKDYHKAQCKTEGGLNRFKKFIKTAPELAGDAGLKEKDLNTQSGTLTEEDKAVCRQMDIPEDEYLKSKKEIS